MAEINFLNGLSKEEVANRRRIRFIKLSPEEKFNAFFSLVELSLLTGKDKTRRKAKLTLRIKSGRS